MSGGKQYRVAPGDRILVDRLAAEPGASVKLGRVLLLSDGKDVKVGSQTDGLEVEAKVIAHRRGPRTEAIRYKSKKHVRVHHGGRAHLTALEIIAVGGVGIETGQEEEETPTKGRARGRATSAPRKKKVEAKAEVAEKAEKAAEKADETRKPARRRTTKKEAE